MVNARWGLRSLVDDPKGVGFVRAEGRTFRDHRCLVPVTEFQVVRDGEPFRVALEDGNWFYLAGIWRPASTRWPDAFAVVTVDANREAARHHSRRGAFLRRNRHMAWLDCSMPEEDILVTPPDGIFTVAPVGSGSQTMLAL